MKNQNKLKLEIVDAYKEILEKENSILHYNRYAVILLHFERFLEEEKLVTSALNRCNIEFDDFKKTKEKLLMYKRTFNDINNDLTYKAYYQMFEEYIFQVLTALFSTYPIFLRSESGKFDVTFENIFSTADIQETQNFIIEKKVKNIIQTNNITTTLNKIEKIFGLDIKISVEDSQELFVASMKRNILTHNNGIINRIYLQELKYQKIPTKYKLGDSISPILDENIYSLAKVVNNISSTIRDRISENLIQLDKYAISLENKDS